MYSCTIIVSHYESLPFLRACVRQIRKYAHPEVEQRIIIIDQSSEDTYDLVLSELWDFADVIENIKPLYSGYGIDYAVRTELLKTDYVCQIHADAFPIHPHWLYLPIKLIEENNFSFVGQLQFISQKTDTIYPPGKQFFAMAQCFNVAKTETYKEMSLEAGFTRFHNRPESGLTFKNNDWAEWASENYAARGSDDDVVAFCWQDRYKEVKKMGLAVTGFIQPNFGRIIEDLVFHFGSCRESIGTGGAMGEQYRQYTERINQDYSDALIEEMVNLAKQNPPPNDPILVRQIWDPAGTTPPLGRFPYLRKRIEELKTVTN